MIIKNEGDVSTKRLHYYILRIKAIKELETVQIGVESEILWYIRDQTITKENIAADICKLLRKQRNYYGEFKQREEERRQKEEEC